MAKEIDDFRRIVGDVSGISGRARLIFRLALSRLRERPGGPIAVQFKDFKAEFELSQGEIAPYAQIQRDIEEGVIPVGPELADWSVVDCGANVGLFSLFLRRARKIVAVEPNPRVARRLRRNLDANAVDASVIEAAISDRDGIIDMNFEGPSVLGSVGGEDTVESLSLDTILDREDVSDVDLLKLDVEGHEIAALKGCENALGDGRVHRVVAEHNDDEALRELDRELESRGFQRTATSEFNALFELSSGRAA